MLSANGVSCSCRFVSIARTAPFCRTVVFLYGIDSGALQPWDCLFINLGGYMSGMDLSVFLDGDVRKVCAEFLIALKKQNWKEALNHCQLTWKNTTVDPVDMLEQLLEFPIVEQIIFIKKSDMKKTKVNTKVIQDVIVFLQLMDINGKMYKQNRKIRLVKEIDTYKPDENGTWGVNPVSFTKVKI